MLIKSIIITGAVGGIGRQAAHRLAGDGYRVIVADNNSIGAEELAHEMGGDTVSFTVDVTDESSVIDLFESAIGSFGDISGIFANAGVSTMKESHELTREDWDFNMDVNAKGVFLTNREFLRHALHRGGEAVIVNTASLAAKVGAPYLAHYSASKFAVLGWTQAIAREYGSRGIRANAVCPGYVKTAMQDREVKWEGALLGVAPEAVRNAYIEATPLKRLAYPDDVADVVSFLFADSSRFITGQGLIVDGGVYMG